MVANFKEQNSEEAEEIRHNRVLSTTTLTRTSRSMAKEKMVSKYTTPQEDRKIRVVCEGKGRLTNGHSGRFSHNEGRALPTQIRSDVAQPGKL